jgi:hypothetical protein
MEPLLELLLNFIGMKKMDEEALNVEDELNPLFYKFLDLPLPGLAASPSSALLTSISLSTTMLLPDILMTGRPQPGSFGDGRVSTILLL